MSASSGLGSPAAARAPRLRSSGLTVRRLPLRTPGRAGGVQCSRSRQSMSLKDELKSLRERAEARRPPEIVAAMRRAVDELRASGAPARVLKVGDTAPHFALPNGDEHIVD